MKSIDFYYDVISPFARLAFDRLPLALQGVSHRVRYIPVLFAGLLKHHGQLGPAEVEPKRAWTYRHVAWLAHEAGAVLDMPASHPFNPLAVLRLALACAPDGHTSRYVTQQVFDHVWVGGLDPNDPQRLAALQARLADHMAQSGHAMPAPDSEAVKARLRANTEAALAKGVFGVPTCVVDGQLFWGQDALPMLRACLDGEPWFRSGAWERAAQVPTGTRRA